MISKAEKLEALKKFGKNENDSGNMAVQVAIITKRIDNLSPHFEKHHKDHNSKRGLMILIGQRKKHLAYLAKHDNASYLNVIKELGLRK